MATPPTGPPKPPFIFGFLESGDDPPLPPIPDPPMPKNDAKTIEFEDKTRGLRLKKLETLAPKQHQAVIALEKILMEYEERFSSLRQAFLISTQNEDNLELKLEYLKQEKALKKFGEALVTKYPELKLSDIDFRSLGNPKNTYADFIAQRAKILNTTVSQIAFLANINVFLNANLERIMQEFQSFGLLRKVYKPIDVASVHFKFIQEGAEKHNRGKAAVLVRFTFTDYSQFRFVFKPRDALLDRNIIKLFKQINQLPLSQKSSVHQLCEYTIISPSIKTGWNIDDDLEPVSLWEFVAGRKSEKERDAYNCIRMEIENPAMRRVMLEKLNHLDAILTELHISDLHHENVLFRGLDGPNPEIFPIDLENIQWNAPTQLGGYPKKIHLSSEEMKLIDTLKKKIYSLVIRILPLNTMNLLALNSYDSCGFLAEKCMENLDRQEFTLTVPKEELKQLLLRDILNSDIPYLTEFQTVLYCGMPYQENVIGRKKDA